MRLDKFLANMGIGSRKDVKTLIKKGKVMINDKQIRDSSYHVKTDLDAVKLNGELISYQEYIYLMLNKPIGYVSATEDEQEKTVIDLLSEEEKHFNPFPVGRLDKDTEGLLLLTNDGELAHHLTSPKKEVKKTYYAKINGRVTEDDVIAFRNGVTLKDNYVTKPADLAILVSNEQSEIELTITEGKYHQVKRMFASQGKKVEFLKRVSMGDLSLDETLKKGSYRELTEDEVNYCKTLVDR